MMFFTVTRYILIFLTIIFMPFMGVILFPHSVTDLSYEMGKFFGPALILFVIGFFLSRKSTEEKKLIVTLIICLILGALTYKNALKREKLHQLNNYLSQYSEDQLKLESDYNKKYSQFDIDISPKNLSSFKKAQQLKSDIEKLNYQRNEFYEKQISLMNLYKERARKILGVIEFENFSAGMASNYQLAQKLKELDQEEILLLNKFVDFLLPLVEQKKLEVSNDNLIYFENESDIEKYKELTQDYELLLSEKRKAGLEANNLRGERSQFFERNNNVKN